MPDPSPPTAALSPTERTTLRRYPDRARIDRSELYAVLDAGFLCFLGTVTDGYPRVTPMTYGRRGDVMYVHGSTRNQGLLAARDGADVCVSVVHVDGLVLATSLFHHSVNFRSATIFGKARVVVDDTERRHALRATGENLVAGRADSLRPPSDRQLSGVLVLEIPLHEASVKVRTGAPGGDESDYAHDTWSGVLPLVQVWGEPEPDPRLRRPLDVPDHVARLVGAPAFGQSSS